MEIVSPRPRVLVLLAIGLVGGLLSGAFGVGGGIILVPLLVTFAGLDQRRASAASLLAILPTSIAGSITYIANGEIDFIAAAFIAVGAIGGAVIGANLLKRIPIVWLRWSFIALLLIVAVRLLFVEPERGEPLALTPWLAVAYLALGLVMGIASGLLGVGGGIIAVPALVGIFGISDLIAKGTSLLVMIPTTVTGTITNYRNGLVNLRTGLIVGAAAAVASVGGAYIALALPSRLAAILFSILLVGIAIQLTVRAIRAQRKP
ncbi:sulfite exporter TauE/SafE family protein [Leifsonia sp. H3M29-4]|uniref:sulfite exporter TauE/SafE family protein n=1 Tax=Salinibacterium metalliresistens TaxID=3031321 RepID=UPI0023DAF4F2|nr:sulfite exporter TauE/SafE family protein [Salinibacterium metalliresistens]MDF1478858.1 sulfite exporter TauE/SafE family protein [Salinibacterium metalliresistens]